MNGMMMKRVKKKKRCVCELERRVKKTLFAKGGCD